MLQSYSSIQDSIDLDQILVNGARTFRDLLHDAKGRHPIELLQALQSGQRNGRFSDEVIRAMIDEAMSADLEGYLPQGTGIALPHPLDAEWRFTEETANSLIEAAAASTKAGARILLMGVPVVVLAAAQSPHDRQFLVRGEPNVITDSLKSYTATDRRFVYDVCASRKADAAILDPPWYLNQFRTMLSASSEECRVGAQLFVSMPPEGLRPGIAKDLSEIAKLARESGLEVIDNYPGALTYRTPYFELNALRAAGVRAWLPEWRRGNLVTYRKSEQGKLLGPIQNTRAFELTLSGVRLRLLLLNEARSPVLAPLYDDEIFPSVSARADRRSEACLWTTGNRAFVADPEATLTALAMIARNRNLWTSELDSIIPALGTSSQLDAVRPLINKLSELADREYAEATSLAGPAGWDTSANDARFLNNS